MYLLHEASSETLRMFEEAYVKRHIRFRNGRASANDDPRCWRPSTWTDDKNMESGSNVVLNGGRKNVQEISAQIGISDNILHKDLNMGSSAQNLLYGLFCT
jgi:hypothetical protein